ncbi:integrase arm-type DNA-binding domain-containing protein [Methylomonas sp. SURF-2]|uniref:Integrase arm-type DNA-binding domain-containing protein n=1 Tax=Methylomonas subterranea TaxID=2952225 RepID=A0ABT1TFM8_9GAMM|nr:integrase arm-type DNA-binding domain-containing protein [Methylomonas sp. SURF-2]MCQ8103549.1 integrase arm-type DNA-binding domain-containing protein [Methylomonas sp. SURF-2]
MPLTDTAIRNAKPSPDKPYKLQDDKGLYLLVNPNGAKYFRYNYRFDGKRKTLALGVYPSTTLKDARDKRDTAKKQLDGGIDPSENKKAIKQAKVESANNSFEVIAREWGQKKVETWSEKNNRSKRMLERNIFPWLGSRPIADIQPKDILACLRRVEERGTIETAHRTLQICGQVFRYAVATGRVERDLTQDLKGALPPAKGEHFAAITEPKEVAELLRAIDSYQGSLPAVCALKLAPLVFVRPGELRAMQWQDVNFETAEWRYFVSKTKVQHIVPLSSQAVEILYELHPVTGHGLFTFPSERTPSGIRCMSENTLNAALKRLGYGKDVMTAHGFRAMARTMLDEILGFRPDFIEHQLAHAVRDPNGRAYNRTAHLPERRKMMQAWADYLHGLKAGAQVIPIRKQG